MSMSIISFFFHIIAHSVPKKIKLRASNHGGKRGGKRIKLPKEVGAQSQAVPSTSHEDVPKSKARKTKKGTH